MRTLAFDDSPDTIDDYVAGNNPVRVVDVFVDARDLVVLGFEASFPKRRPAHFRLSEKILDRMASRQIS